MNNDAKKYEDVIRNFLKDVNDKPVFSISKFDGEKLVECFSYHFNGTMKGEYPPKIDSTLIFNNRMPLIVSTLVGEIMRLKGNQDDK